MAGHAIDDAADAAFDIAKHTLQIDLRHSVGERMLGIREHALTDEAVAEFEELLGYPQHDPHGREIPKRRRSS